MGGVAGCTTTMGAERGLGAATGAGAAGFGATVLAVAVKGFGLAAAGGGAVAFFAGMAGIVAGGAGEIMGFVAAGPAAGAVGFTFRGFFPGEAVFAGAGLAADCAWAGAVAAAGCLVSETDFFFVLATGDFAATGALGVGVAGVDTAGTLMGGAVAAKVRAMPGDFGALAAGLAEAVTAVLDEVPRRFLVARLRAAGCWNMAALAEGLVFGADAGRMSFVGAGRVVGSADAGGAGTGFGATVRAGVRADAPACPETDCFGATGVGAFRGGLDSVARGEARFPGFRCHGEGNPNASGGFCRRR